MDKDEVCPEIGSDGRDHPQQKISRILLPGLVFAFLIFLLVCFVFRGKNKTSLVGVTLASEPLFTADGLFNGTYQSGWGKWLNDNFYGHTFFVKCHNQIQYSLFRDGNGDWVLGKGFNIQSSGSSYAYATGGKLSASQETLDAYAEKVKKLQTELEQYGKDFIYLLTPAKAAVYSDELPWYDKLIAARYVGQSQTNQEKMIAAFEKYGVNYYSMSEDILKMRETADFEIFPKTGYHWTLTAVATELGQIMDDLRSLGPHIDFPDLQVVGLNDEVYLTDKDIYTQENVFKGVLSEEYHSPIIEYSHRSPNKVYFFGTSMTTAMYYALTTGSHDRAFDDILFQEYFTFQWFNNENGEQKINYKASDPESAYKILENIRDRDLVIMEHSGLRGAPEPHYKFLDYVVGNIGAGLYYQPGTELIDISDETIWANMKDFYGLRDEGSRWTEDAPTITVYGDRLYNAGRNAIFRFTAGSYGMEHTVKVKVNGETVETLQIAPTPRDYAVTIPAEFLRDDANTVELHIMEDILSPKKRGESDDWRYLGLAIYSMRLEVSE